MKAFLSVLMLCTIFPLLGMEESPPSKKIKSCKILEWSSSDDDSANEAGGIDSVLASISIPEKRQRDIDDISERLAKECRLSLVSKEPLPVPDMPYPNKPIEYQFKWAGGINGLELAAYNTALLRGRNVSFEEWKKERSKNKSFHSRNKQKY